MPSRISSFGQYSRIEETEVLLRCRQPVGFLLFTWRFLLQVQGQRTVVIKLQLVPVADRVASDRILDEELVGVVHSDRPESSHRGQLSLAKRIV